MLRQIANPEMVVVARLSRGLSQGDLARKIEVSQGLVSKIEHGTIHPTDAVITRVAGALDYPASFFYRPERPRGTDSICLHHRKRKTIPTKLLASVEAQMFLAALHVRSLLEDLDVEYPFDFVTIDPDDYDGDPRTVAQVVRRLWQVPAGPVTNLVRLIEAAGGVVVIRDFGTPKVDGMSCWPKGCPPLFFLNKQIPVDRMRFTLAHELAHLTMHATPPATDPEEEANDFALEFLAPAANLTTDLRRLRFDQLPALKQHWRLSMSAIVMAAKKYGALPQSRVNSLFVQLSRAGYRTNEPYPLSEETPSVLDAAIDVHLREHGYSEDQLAEVVGLNTPEFRELYLPTDRSPRRKLRVL